MRAETEGFLTPAVTGGCLPVSPFSVTRSQNRNDPRIDIKEPAASSANEKVCQYPQLRLRIRHCLSVIQSV